MRKFLLGALFTLIPIVALAEVLEWDAPIQRENGIPLKPDDLKEYRLYDKRIKVKAIPAPTTATTVIILQGRSYAWEVTAVDKNGMESTYSNPVLWIPTPVPTLQWPPVAPKNLELTK